MKKNSIIYGLIAGIVVSIPMLFSVNSLNNPNGIINFENSMLVGYASMLIAFSLVFVGIRNYRNHYNNGVITFWKAFKTGFTIVFIASTIYVLAWLIDFFYFIPEFTEKYAEHILSNLKASGASQAVIDQKTREMADFSVMYRNPFFNALITYTEILPVGIVVTLISSLILRKKAAAPENQTT